VGVQLRIRCVQPFGKGHFEECFDIVFCLSTNKRSAVSATNSVGQDPGTGELFNINKYDKMAHILYLQLL